MYIMEINKLIVKNLTATRGGRELFCDISFFLKGGEGLVISGANGTGKSTLLSILAGILRPCSGSVEFSNKDDVACFHYITTLNGLKNQLSVYENLSFWQNFYTKSTRDLPIETALEKLNLLHVQHTPYGYLSTGQKRRASLARLLCTKRSAWILDEPTSGLDKESETLFAALVRSHLNEGGILIAASHLPIGLNDLQNINLSDM
jgi:heme exporter protein A